MRGGRCGADVLLRSMELESSEELRLMTRSDSIARLGVGGDL